MQRTPLPVWQDAEPVELPAAPASLPQSAPDEVELELDTPPPRSPLEQSAPALAAPVEPQSVPVEFDELSEPETLVEFELSLPAMLVELEELSEPEMLVEFEPSLPAILVELKELDEDPSGPESLPASSPVLSPPTTLVELELDGGIAGGIAVELAPAVERTDVAAEALEEFEPASMGGATEPTPEPELASPCRFTGMATAAA